VATVRKEVAAHPRPERVLLTAFTPDVYRALFAALAETGE